MDNPSWLDVSRETIEELRSFESAVIKWNKSIQLVSKSSINDIWTRHILDSAQLYAEVKDNSRWVDVGSGGGFPAIVLAIIAKNMNRGTEFILVESDRRKAAFLQKCVADYNLSAQVIVDNVQNVTLSNVSVISARALASIDVLFDLLGHLAVFETRFVFMKGKNFDEEVKKAKERWDFSLSSLQSKTNSEARILTFQGVKSVEAT